MPVVTQKDYVIIDNNELQLALKQYVKEKYGRDVDGKFFVDTNTDCSFNQTYKARADLKS